MELLVTEAPDHLLQLAQWGMPFARTDDGAIDQRYFGAHRYRRTCYAGDWTGRALLETLLDQVERRGIGVGDGRDVSHLLVEDGVCGGALAFDLATGERTALLADAVALANDTEIREGRAGPHGGVFLDLTHLDRATIREKLPRMYRQFVDAQLLDIAEEPMEVSPTAHYSMGGVSVTPESAATEVEGLFAAGEITGGLHGANRLGGNSLIETVVFGARAGTSAAERSRSLRAHPRPLDALHAANQQLEDLTGDGEVPAPLAQHELRTIMWEHVGVVREEHGLARAIAGIEELEAVLDDVEVRPDAQGHGDLAAAMELRGALLLARMTATAARARTETRGAHQRRDHPERDDEQHLVSHVATLGPDGELAWSTRSRAPIPDRLRDWARAAQRPDEEDRLLE